MNYISKEDYFDSNPSLVDFTANFKFVFIDIFERERKRMQPTKKRENYFFCTKRTRRKSRRDDLCVHILYN